MHLHCKNLILCYPSILATDPGTTTTSCVVCLWNIWIFPGYPHGYIPITCVIPHSLEASQCEMLIPSSILSSEKHTLSCTSWGCLASVFLHRQCAQTGLEAVLLLPALPAAALCLSWGKITGSSQRGLVLISHTSLSYSCRLLVSWGKCSQHSTPHCSLWLMEPWVPQIPPSPILLLWMHLLVKTRECN